MIQSDTIQTIEIGVAVITPVIMIVHISHIMKLLENSGMDKNNYLLVFYLALVASFLWIIGFGLTAYFILSL